MQKKEWTDVLVSSVRPVITYLITAMVITVVLHGALWCGDFRFAVAGFGLANLVIGYWFAKRSSEKSIEQMSQLLEMLLKKGKR